MSVWCKSCYIYAWYACNQFHTTTSHIFSPVTSPKANFGCISSELNVIEFIMSVAMHNMRHYPLIATYHICSSYCNVAQCEFSCILGERNGHDFTMREWERETESQNLLEGRKVSLSSTPGIKKESKTGMKGGDGDVRNTSMTCITLYSCYHLSYTFIIHSSHALTILVYTKWQWAHHEGIMTRDISHAYQYFPVT